MLQLLAPTDPGMGPFLPCYHSATGLVAILLIWPASPTSPDRLSSARMVGDEWLAGMPVRGRAAEGSLRAWSDTNGEFRFALAQGAREREGCGSSRVVMAA